jgi:hypothetical protein
MMGDYYAILVVTDLQCRCLEEGMIMVAVTISDRLLSVQELIAVRWILIWVGANIVTI